ncbi:hypothetical protein GCM10027160_29640 [Streptomyces calidiresistens]|uniref:Uncharacterized protein n=1 Tax=Streptomyces calidiresistens TaxID=1485586 RepID=A0A7W3T6S7_9ACTN|nr:DUF6716 putative glycosyltransferase [Streptomyces calidiresistens]MBB0231701.1 hypothetical protein [Streptomyces calidiresistens]
MENAGTRQRVVVLADSDSRWKWAALTARRLAPDHALDARFLRGDSAPSQRQISEVGIVPDTSRSVDCADLLEDPACAEADLLVLGVTGGSVMTVLHGLSLRWADRTRRPIVVTGYVGVAYENQVDGTMLRIGSDVVLANSAHDADLFREVYAGVGADPGAIVESALPYLDGAPWDPAAAGRDRPFTVCFAVQPSVPAGRGDRLSLLRRLRHHALLHPDREVLVKLRNRPDEGVTHVERHSYQKLFEELPDRPANLSLRYGDMGEILDRTDLLVTVSSTAAMEAVHRGIPAAIITDYGIREAHGNHFFVGSGLLASFTDLDSGLVPKADPDWAARHGLGRTDPWEEARARIARLRAAGPLPPLRPHYTAEHHAPYLEPLLRRRGVGLDGERVRAPEPATVGPVRRLVVRGAGGLYRMGRRRVAPAIRRLARG